MQHEWSENSECPASTLRTPSDQCWFESVCREDADNPASYGASPEIQTAIPPPVKVDPQAVTSWADLTEDFPDLFYDCEDAEDYIVDVQNFRGITFRSPDLFHISVHWANSQDVYCTICRRTRGSVQNRVEDRTLPGVLPSSGTGSGGLGQCPALPEQLQLQEPESNCDTCQCASGSSHAVGVRSKYIDGGLFTEPELGNGVCIYRSLGGRRGAWGRDGLARLQDVHALVTAEITSDQDLGDDRFYESISFPYGHDWDDNDD